MSPEERAESLRRDGLERRDQLLDAALRCFVERGILSTRIEDVRRAAGASPSSVYHLFRGLPELTAALLTRTFERVLRALTDRVVATESAEAAVRALVLAHVDWVLAHPDEARFMYQAMALELAGEEQPRLLAMKAELERPLFAHLARFVAAGTLPDWPPLALQLVLLGPSHDACRRHLSVGDVDPAWMRAALPAIAWAGVAGARRVTSGAPRGQR